ncbi:MAG: hypothetical protein EP326_11170 [Deltaproteobacteria bacterium]|nr:MAG: hypothetical protein EP326_11170 [Deltaproteobacteria bacterium]TNF25948.1 MAG: hypothetical protein EP319_15025 [Deltaproteobacteria bacterium]
MKKTILTLALLTSISAFSAVDLDNYQLKPHQISLLKKLEAKGWSDDKIRDMAEKFEDYNLNGPADRNEYIPPHTWQDLMNVTDWAAGASFSAFAKQAGVTFDNASYWEDCPNKALFNFGRATGTQYLRVDVLVKVSSLSYALQQYFARDTSSDKSEFKKHYFRLLETYHFEQYVKIIEVDKNLR